MNGEVSTSWGDAIHKALELYHRYGSIGALIADRRGLEENYVLPKNPYLAEIVNKFVSKFGLEAAAEVVVSDVKNGMAGTIDRLEIKDGHCRIGDYKTNNDLDKKKLEKYQKQLSFYAKILQNHGWEVDGLDIYHYDTGSGEWNKTEVEVLDLE